MEVTYIDLNGRFYGRVLLSHEEINKLKLCFTYDIWNKLEQDAYVLKTVEDPLLAAPEGYELAILYNDLLIYKTLTTGPEVQAQVANLKSILGIKDEVKEDAIRPSDAQVQEGNS